MTSVKNNKFNLPVKYPKAQRNFTEMTEMTLEGDVDWLGVDKDNR